jgi:hypothetical protein
MAVIAPINDHAVGWQSDSYLSELLRQRCVTEVGGEIYALHTG